MRVFKDIRDWYLVYKKTALISMVLIMIIGSATFGAVSYFSRVHSPVPKRVKSQINFTVLYPKGYPITENSWSYLASEATLSFTLPNNGNPIIFTEQAVPLAYKDDAAAYDRFIGSLKPGINFKVPLGTASLVGFVTAGDYSPQGRSAVLNSHGTLLIAHPEQMLGDTDWYSLLNSLTTD